MKGSDKNRVLNFFIGNEPIHEFESWVYTNTDLEERIGSQLYFELINVNYKDKFVLDELKRNVLGNYISQDDFESFKYENVLRSAGWIPNRKIEVDISKVPNNKETKNALKIIEEFGGLKFVLKGRPDNQSLTLIEFLTEPGKCYNMSKYGVSKKLVCFASAHNDHIDLFVDKDNNYYQLDNVVGEDLYVFKDLSFTHLMRQLLELDEEDNFIKIGKREI